MASETDALMLDGDESAGTSKHMVMVAAGNSPLSTVLLTQAVSASINTRLSARAVSDPVIEAINVARAASLQAESRLGDFLDKAVGTMRTYRCQRAPRSDRYEY